MSYSFHSQIRLESDILRQESDDLFEAALEFELNCIRSSAREARDQALEDKHANLPNRKPSERSGHWEDGHI